MDAVDREQSECRQDQATLHYHAPCVVLGAPRHMLPHQTELPPTVHQSLNCGTHYCCGVEFLGSLEVRSKMLIVCMLYITDLFPTHSSKLCRGQENCWGGGLTPNAGQFKH